jgi:hypothetical protein
MTLDLINLGKVVSVTSTGGVRIYDNLMQTDHQGT